jgi:hypothetical protein
MQTEETIVAAPSPPTRIGGRTRRRIVIAIAAAAVLAAAVVAVFETGVFSSGGTAGNASADNAYPTSITTVRRQSLSSQTQVSATLGYAGATTIAAAAGPQPSDLQQDEQQLNTAKGQLTTARATLSSDSQTLDQAKATLSADRQKLAVDCSGAGAGESAASSPGGATGNGNGNGNGAGSGACATDAQALSTDQQSSSQASAKVAMDSQSVASAQAGVSAAEASLAEAQASATFYGQSSTYTALPALGRIVRRGGTLYEIGGQPVVLLYGTVAPWRAYLAGMTPGADVAALNANLHALGYGHGLGGDEFTSATTAAIDAFQAARGLPQTGKLLLGSVVFEPGAIRVTSVTPTVGATVQSGPVLGVTSLVRQVTIELDAAQQSEVKVGDPVEITLPDNSLTPGRISYVGTVATVPSSSDQGGGGGGGNGSSSPTIEVDVTPTDPAATGRLDQAPVNVSITTGSVRNALVVPVNALLALASGGYAVEAVGPGGVHHLVGVRTGLFDDADGFVQVTGAGLRPGMRVVIPGE